MRVKPLLAGIGLLLLLLLPGLLRAAAPLEQGPIRIGVLAFRPQPETQAAWQPTADHLSRTLGRRFEVAALGYDELDRAMRERRVDFVLTNPGHYVLWMERAGLTRIATVIGEQDGKPVRRLGGVILVRAEREELRSLADLRGRRIASPGVESLGGYQAQAMALALVGVGPPAGELLLQTDMPHDRAVAALLAGRADAAFVRSGVVEQMVREGRLDLGAVRVLNPLHAPDFPYLHSTRLYPEWPFSVLPHVPNELARQVSVALLTMPPDHEALRLGRYRGWDIPADYGLVRELLQTLRLPPFDDPLPLAEVAREYLLALLAGLVAFAALTFLATRLYVTNRKLKEGEERYRSVVNALTEGIVLQRADGSVTAANPAARRILDSALEVVIGRVPDVSAWRLLAWDGSPFVPDQHPFGRCLATGQAVRDVVIGVQSAEDGMRTWLRVNAEPIGHGGTHPDAVVTSFQDITGQYEAERLLAAAHAQIERLLVSAGEGIYGVDPEGRCTFVNPEALSLLGFTREEVIGADQHGLFHHHRPDGSEYPADECPVRLTLQDGQPRHSEEWFIRKDGSLLPVAMTVTAIVEGGERLGADVLFQDISIRREMEGVLASAHRQRKALLDNSGVTLFLASPERVILEANRRAVEMFGYRLDEMVGASFRMIHVDEEHFRAFGEYYAELLRCGEIEIEYPFRRSDGSQLWCLVHGGLLDPARPGQGTVWTLLDVTARREAEAALQAARTRLTTILASFAGAVLVEDEHRCIALANQAFCDLFGIPLPPTALIGFDCARSAEQSKALFADPERFVARIDEILTERRPVIAEELSLADQRAVERDYLPVISESGFIGHLWIYRDITERKQRERDLHHLATTDPLTGLANRRAFLERLDQELNRLRRFGEPPVALLMIDLDHFKRVNDTYGHAAGDQVLRAAAALMRAALRRTDHAGRLGGEEFALLLPGTAYAQAQAFAERLRLRFCESKLEQVGAVTVSVGVTLLEPTDPSGDAPLARADAALYRAKQQGRNRVEAG